MSFLELHPMFDLIVADGVEGFAKLLGGPLLVAAMFAVSLVPQILGVLAIEFFRTPDSKSRVRRTANWLSLIALSFQVYAIIVAVIGVCAYLFVNRTSNNAWNSETTRTFVIGALTFYPVAAGLLFYKSAARVPRDYFVFLDRRSLKSIATFRFGKPNSETPAMSDRPPLPMGGFVPTTPPKISPQASTPPVAEAVPAASAPPAMFACPTCAMRVILKSDGTCPGCGQAALA